VRRCARSFTTLVLGVAIVQQRCSGARLTSQFSRAQARERSIAHAICLGVHRARLKEAPIEVPSLKILRKMTTAERRIYFANASRNPRPAGTQSAALFDNHSYGTRLEDERLDPVALSDSLS